MPKAKTFTPGPWQADPDHRDLLNGPSPRVVADRSCIAHFLSDAYLGAGESGKANARPAAAAPDLLEALEHILATGGSTLSILSLAKAEASVAKARRGTPGIGDKS